jgi:TolB-like protein
MLHDGDEAAADAGDDVRINLSLIDTRTAKQLRTDTITGGTKDLFAL